MSLISLYLQEDPKPPVFKKQDYNDGGFQSRTVFKGDEYAYQTINNPLINKNINN